MVVSNFGKTCKWFGLFWQKGTSGLNITAFFAKNNLVFTALLPSVAFITATPKSIAFIN